jgi:hypothetical protein
MAEHQVVYFKTTVTTATHATSCRTLTSELSGRGDYEQRRIQQASQKNTRPCSGATEF